MTGLRLCGARTRAGGTCRRPAMVGQLRCDLHGGKSPQALRAAQRRLAEERALAKARRTLEDLGQPAEPVTDPLGALEALAGESVRLVEVLRGMVADLEEVRYRGGPGSGTEQVRGELQAYLSALRQAESVLGRILALDLEGRRVRVAEAQVAVVLAALAKVLAHGDLGLDAERQRLARQLLARELGASVEKEFLLFPSPPPRSVVSDTSPVRESPLAPPGRSDD